MSSRGSRSALRVPVEPQTAEDLQTQPQPPVGAISRTSEHWNEVKISLPGLHKAMLKDIQETVAGMRQFLNRVDDSGDEAPQRGRRRAGPREPEERGGPDRMVDPLQLAHLRSHYGESTRYTPNSVLPKSPWATATESQPRPATFKSMLEQRAEPKVPLYPTNNRRHPRYAREEEEEDAEDEEFFRARYEQENVEAEEIDLGPYFVYPSRRTFEKYFGEFDFIKHVRHGTLSKFDGTVKGYPAFRKNFYELVYVQRVGYLHKLMALEYMVPDKVQKELFGDLDNSAAHFGRRIKRLEQRFGGQDRQEQYLIEVLTEAKAKASGRRLPYQELLELARHVDSHLAKGFRFAGTSDPILVHLRDLVPHHIKTAFSMEMLRCGAEETGKAFLKYLLDAVRVEMRAQKSNPKRGEGDKATQQDKNKVEKPKVLGKLYGTKGKVHRRRSSSSSGSEDNTTKMDKRATDTETENQVYTGISRPRNVEPPQCNCCREGAHFLYNCYQFVHGYSVAKKKRFAESDGRCFRCLRSGHLRADCFGREVECRFCRSTTHHYLLCMREDERAKGERGEVKVTQAQVEKTSPAEEDVNFEALGEIVTQRRVTPLQTVLHILDQEGQMVTVNAMPDTGSTHNIIEMETLKKLGLKGTRCKYTVTGHGGHTSTHEAVCATVTLCSPDGKNKYPVKFFAYENPCGGMVPDDWSRLKRGWPHLKKLDIPPPVPGRPIEAILGCVSLTLFEAIRPTAIRGTGDPVAKWTPLGWMVGGRTRPEVEPVDEGLAHTHEGTILMAEIEKVSQIDKDVGKEYEMTSASCFSDVVKECQECGEGCKQEYQDLKNNMRRIWELETEEEIRKLANTYYPAVRSQKQLEAEATILRQLEQLPGGQYQTGLLWSSDHRPRSNWEGAKLAFLHWEKRLEKDATLKKAFHMAVGTWIQNDFIQKAEGNITAKNEQYFLTCFMVLKEGQPLEKGRLVVNGARVFEGKSLNDYLETGPNLMNDLSDILLKLRRHKWVVCCDMQNMFLNIKVSPKDRKFLRLFYRSDPTQELEVFEFTVHVFGLASSPCVAMRVVREHASRHREKWPIAEEALRKSSLVDDVWFTSSNVEPLERGIREIVELTASMGIQVHKWGANLEELIRHVPAHQRAKTFQINCEGQGALKALGIAWDTQTDEFLFLQGPPKMEKWTLRTMSSSAGQLYDPLGLISPTTLPGKLLIQSAWRYQKGWDEEVPEVLGNKMDLYCKNQQKLSQVRFPRYLGHEEGRLVMFSDASRMAQAAAAYWVTGGPHPSGEKYESRLIASKVKLTGLRQVEHIGRLELVAAVMSVMLAVKICIALGLSLEHVLFFTDSMAVLYWLSTTAPLSVYAGHRVAKICERTSWKQWKYVYTAENPSDLPTRGMRAEDLNKSDLWMRGPTFLRKDLEEWPEQPYIRKTEEAAAEERTVEEICKGIMMGQREDSKWKVLDEIRARRNGFKKQVGILTKIYRFLTKYLRTNRYEKTQGEVQETYIRYDQELQFTKLLEELKGNQFVKTHVDLQPFLDDSRLIRVGMGLHPKAAFDWNTKTPYLLHAEMMSAKAIMREIHYQGLAHQNGVEGILAEVRKRYWIIGARKLARNIIKECMRCAKRKWTELQVEMPPLHPSRSTTLRAFTEVGVDHAGPFRLRQGRSTVDAHVLVIACCTTRAVSLEMSMSTGAGHVLAALQRHVGVFGSPRYINSDQGSGFVRAKRLISESQEVWRKEGWEMHESVDWRLNPPYSPTWTGHVESLVKLTKKALLNLHQGPVIQALTPDEFYTQLKRAQGYINMRPLLRPETQMPLLTPADFIGSGSSQLVNLTWRPEFGGNLGYRYRQLEEIRTELWKVFRESYVVMLRRQNTNPMGTWTRPEVGDLVLAADVPEWSGDGWPVARIVRVIQGEDGKERLFELAMVPAEELKKEPQKINEKMRLRLKKKTIIRNHRKVGLLPKTYQPMVEDKGIPWEGREREPMTP